MRPAVPRHPMVLCALLCACASGAGAPGEEHSLQVNVSGIGTVVSTPPGIDCAKGSGTCSARFAEGSAVLLEASDPGGWSGACSGFSRACTVTVGRRLNAVGFASPVACAGPLDGCPPGAWCVAGWCEEVGSTPGYVAVDFSVDDTANGVYADGDLEWMGSFRYTEASRILENDLTWGGPFPALYDDGPWTSGGHEPEGSTAGDHVLGATAFVMPPHTQAEVDAGEGVFGYGVIDVTYVAEFGNGWVWPGSNGTLHVPLDATGRLTATGMTFAPFGTNDLRLTLDTGALAPRDPPWSLATVEVMGSAWAWGRLALADDSTRGDLAAGDGVFTFVLSEWVGPGRLLEHSGLLTAGTGVDFVFVLGGQEYRLDGATAHTAGVGAAARPAGGAFGAAPIAGTESGALRVIVP